MIFLVNVNCSYKTTKYKFSIKSFYNLEIISRSGLILLTNTIKWTELKHTWRMCTIYSCQLKLFLSIGSLKKRQRPLKKKGNKSSKMKG